MPRVDAFAHPHELTGESAGGYAIVAPQLLLIYTFAGIPLGVLSSHTYPAS